MSQSALYQHTAKQHGDRDVHGPAFVHPAAVSEEAASGGGAARWRELLEPGVRRALFCGVMIQILQQVTIVYDRPMCQL